LPPANVKEEDVVLKNEGKGRRFLVRSSTVKSWKETGNAKKKGLPVIPGTKKKKSINWEMAAWPRETAG